MNIEKHVLPKSWQSSAYQQAIKRARRRLAGKQSGEISYLEAKILSDNLLAQSKPDYSRWLYNDLMEGKRYGGITARKFKLVPDSPRRPASRNNLTAKESVSLQPENFNVKALVALPSVGEITYHHRPSAAAIEFLSVVDQAPVYEPPSSRQRPISLSTSHENVGLCAGCFHHKGPHHHYQSPIRIGGGYSIYHREPSQSLNALQSNARLNTIKWLADIGKKGAAGSKGGIKGYGDDYSVKLFEQYISNGGDAMALKEYLDSNFSQEVLEELRQSGVNVQLILEYTELYRNHVKSMIEENIQQQTQLVEQHSRTLELAVLFSSIEGEGVNMKILLAVLKGGRTDEDVVKFENEGGNIEIVEHFAQEINNDPSRDLIIDEFEKIITKMLHYEKARLFLNFLKSGGEIETLKKCAENASSTLEETTSLFEERQAELLTLCSSQFSSFKLFLEELKFFLEYHLHLYQGAELLQFYMESGGSIKTLKKFVESDCTVLVENEDESSSAVDIELLKTVGQQFNSEPTLKKILEEFPEEAQVIDVYLQAGGNFAFLVNAIADITEAPRLSDYVKQQSDETHRRISEMVNLTASKEEIKQLQSNERFLPTLLLPRILEKAKADLIYDELVETENSFIVNEGACLAKTMDFQGLVMNPVSSVNVSERREVNHLYHSLVSPNDSSSVSSVTGKKRNKLWTAPKPFEIKESEHSPTQPQSPFSQHRVFQISSLTENHIMDAAKQQRNQLDALRRNFHVEDFQKNWKLSITSPRGSIVSGNSNLEKEQPSQSLLDKVIAILPQQTREEKTPSPAPAVDRKSRRKQQRAKMREIKRESSGGRRSPGARSNASTPNSLSVPAVDNYQTVPDRKLASEDTQSSSNELNQMNEKSIEKQPSTIEMDAAEKEKRKTPETTNDETFARSSPLTVHFEKKLPIPTISEPDSPIFKEQSEEKLYSKYATAFGPKGLTSSFSSLLSANTMKQMRDDPDTMISSVDISEKLLSKSDSNIGRTESLRKKEKRQKKLRNKRRSSRKSVRTYSYDELSSVESATNEENELVDILKRYCIIREDRLHIYRRLFNKYVLIKSMRDREQALEVERMKRHAKQNEDLKWFMVENSVEAEMKKSEYILEKLRENIEDIQQHIIVMKREVTKAVAKVALRKYGESLNLANEDKIKHSLPSITNMHHAPEAYQENAILRSLSPNMRLQCEADKEVRNCKVTLVHLRDKSKKLLKREKALKESLQRLVKRVEHEKLEEGFRQREKQKFTRKQSFIYRELHPFDNDVIESCDMREALNDLDPTLSNFDPSQLIEEIVREGGVTFQVFCVVAALHEAKNIQQPEFASLGGKINACKKYYGDLLGPGLDVLRLELEAAGIKEKQRNAIIKKLSRGNTNELDFLDFVTYVPLFLDIHSKIVANPLPT